MGDDERLQKAHVPVGVSRVHTGQVESAREVFETIERFVGEVLTSCDQGATVIVTSDHGHLEQLSSSRGHPKSKVPTWYFGPDSACVADTLRRPEGIFHVLTAT